MLWMNFLIYQWIICMQSFAGLHTFGLVNCISDSMKTKIATVSRRLHCQTPCSLRFYTLVNPPPPLKQLTVAVAVAAAAAE